MRLIIPETVFAATTLQPRQTQSKPITMIDSLHRKAGDGRARWLLVKTPDDLAEEERPRLAAMLAASPELKHCYELKEKFWHSFNYLLYAWL